MRLTDPPINRAGMSLFVTLAAVITLTALAAAIMARGSHTVTITAIAQRQLTATIDQRSALAVARYMVTESGLIVPDGRMVEIQVLGRLEHVSVQDVYGLIDVNAASPILMARFLSASVPNISPAAIDDLHQAHRFERVADFLTRLGVTGADAHALTPSLTVASGRRRISPESAPLTLLEQLAGQHGSRAELIAALPDSFFEARSPVTFLIGFPGEGAPQ